MNTLFKQAKVVARLQGGLFGRYLPHLIQRLRERDYAPSMVCQAVQGC